MSAIMTRAEQSDLLRLIRGREKVAKTAAAQRAAEMRADFAAKLAATFSFDQDALWKSAHDEARKAVLVCLAAEASARLGHEVPLAFD